MTNIFTRFAGWSAWAAGHPGAFVLATAGCIVWAISGPIFNYSDTWQLVINTATAVLTFLMVFVLQHSQNRDAVAIQAKLDELIKHTKEARDDLMVFYDKDGPGQRSPEQDEAARLLKAAGARVE